MRIGMIWFLLWSVSAATAAQISIGSKAFTEGYLLAELAAEIFESATPYSVTRRFGMGGTGILYEALKKGEIDVYPEYTGTISQAILKNPSIKSWSEIQLALKPMNLMMSPSLGFQNTYALAVKRSFATKHGLKRISDLRRLTAEIRAVLSHEFMTREDGFPNLVKRYRLDMKNVASVEHSLAFEAIANDKADLIDVYSTDAKIEKLDLVVLNDDLEYFPKYEAVYLFRSDFRRRFPLAWKGLLNLKDRFSEAELISMNSQVDNDRKSFSEVIGKHLDVEVKSEQHSEFRERLLRRTQEHLVLVGISLLFAAIVGIPLGIFVFRHRKMGEAILILSSIVQTIPSLALLCFLIPFFGIGTKPAIVALCLYSLLPVVLNTVVGLRSIDPALVEVARSLGLSQWEILRRIQLPLASRSILVGIKTSAVISIGTATLAALIGAGGYGVPIVTGLAINDTGTILMGAVPAAVMAFVAHWGFELVSRFCVPGGLRDN